MAELISFGKNVTLEKYIRDQVSVNNGASTRIKASVLQEVLDECGAEYNKTAMKDELLDGIYEFYQSWEKIAEVLEIGVQVNHYTEAFPFLTKSDIKRFEKFNQIKVIGKERFSAYGKYMYATLYDLKQFVSLTEDDMRLLLQQFPKGMRSKKST